MNWRSLFDRHYPRTSQGTTVNFKTPRRVDALQRRHRRLQAGMPLAEVDALWEQEMGSERFSWVIECAHPGGHTLYWTGKGTVDFSPYHADAIQFSREQDARKVRDWTLRNPFLHVVEHGWSH